MSNGKNAVIVSTKKLMEKYKEEMTILQDYLTETGYRIICAYTESLSKIELKDLLQNEDTCLLITMNLQGFHLGTVSGGLWYNFLPYRSIHLIWDSECLNILPKPPVRFSISMFFFLLGKAGKKPEETEKYEFPYLKKTDDICEVISLISSEKGDIYD